MTKFCPDCEIGIVISKIVIQKFQYGSEDPVELAAEVTAFVCQDCGYAFTDGDAEPIRETAVKKYLETLSSNT